MHAIVATRALPGSNPLAFEPRELPDPTPGDQDLLIRVEAVAVNPVDTKVRASLPKEPGPARILGWDGAGVVTAAGGAVRGFSPGDAVFFAGDITRPGCYAEKVLVDWRLCGPKPISLSFGEAAALPLTSLTAWEALFERIGLDSEGADAGRRLLILAGAGGVGSIAIQLARRAGLEVIATASRPQSRAWCLQMGASQVVDHSQPMAPQLAALGYSEIDAIANFCDTDAYWNVMAELVKPQGAIVCIVGNHSPLDLNVLKSKSVRFAWEYMFTRPQFRTADMAQQGVILGTISKLVDSGVLRSTCHDRLSPINADTLGQAHVHMQSGQAIGKLVLEGWEQTAV
jgi:zinc-binding alcohol dehydrogenase family protein